MIKGNIENLVNPGVLNLTPYQPGKPISELERELGIKNIIKLASNENPLGPSLSVLTALQQALPELARYPDGNGYDLKKALSEKLAVACEQITLGNGSNDVLELIARVFLSPQHEAVFSQHAFAVYPIVTQSVGAKARIAPAADGTEGPRYGHDLKAMAKLVNEATRVVFIANPNNPTGTYLKGGELERFIAFLPDHVIVVVDEAYFEYVEEPDYPNALTWLTKYPNLVVTRTFSKIYGLAGLRIGYGLSSPTIADLLNRVRQPFNVNALALVVAEAALKEQDHVMRSVRVNRKGLRQLSEAFVERGLEFIPSAANFICFDVKQDAKPVYDALLREGVIVRPVAGYELPRHLRVTVGTEEENNLFIKALDSVLGYD